MQSSSGAGAAKLMLAANTSVGPAVELMNSKVVKAMGAWLSGVTSIYFLYNLFVRLMIAHHCLFKLISMDSKKQHIHKCGQESDLGWNHIPFSHSGLMREPLIVGR